MEIFPQDVNRYLTGVNDIQKIFIKLHKVGCDIVWLIDGVKQNNISLVSSDISNLLTEEKDNIINTLTIENIILKTRLEEKDRFINLFFENQNLDIKPNLSKLG